MRLQCACTDAGVLPVTEFQVEMMQHGCLFTPSESAPRLGRREAEREWPELLPNTTLSNRWIVLTKRISSPQRNVRLIWVTVMFSAHETI